MRKITSLFSLLLLCMMGAMTAVAQNPDATPLTQTEVPTGYYYIASTSASIGTIESPYIADGANGSMMIVGKKHLTNDKVGIWYISKEADYTDTEGNSVPKYYIKSIETGNYWTTGPDCPLNSNAVYYQISYDADGSTYTFKGHPDQTTITNRTAVNYNGSAFNRTDDGANNTWKLIPVSYGESKTISLTCNYTLNGTAQTITNDAYTTYVGADLAKVAAGMTGAPSTYLVYTAEGTITAADNSYSYTAALSYPFSISTADATTYNYLRTRNGYNYNLYYDATTGHIISRNSPDGTPLTTMENVLVRKNLVANGQWSFTLKEGSLNQFYIANRANNLKMTLSSTADLTFVTLTETGTAFYVTNQNTGENIDSYDSSFSIKPSEKSDYAIGDIKENGIKYSADFSDENYIRGTIFRLPDWDESTDIETIKKTISTDNKQVGMLTDDAAKTFSEKEFSSLDELFKELDNETKDESKLVKPNEHKLYNIWFKRGEQYISCENNIADANGNVEETDDDARTVTAEDNGESPAMIFRFVPIENTTDQYYIQNVNSLQTLGTTVTDANTYATLKTIRRSNPEWGGKYSVAYNVTGTLGELALKDNAIAEGNTVNNNGYNAGQYLSAPYEKVNDTRKQANKFSNHLLTLTSASTEIEPGVVLYIREVTTLPVKFSKNSEYATINLPFAVSLPDDVKAYAATGVTTTTDGTQEVTMTEIEETVPANTAVVLIGKKNKEFDLTILADDNSSYEGTNLMTGATVKRTGLTAESYYGLSYNKDDGGVKFRKSNITTVPANKVYLTAESLASAGVENAAALAFNFGGNTTGIDTINKTTEADNVYYDLNGRRVLYPAHGLYVKGNGQKVFLK